MIDYDFEKEAFDFIFLDPYPLHPRDRPKVIYRIIDACKKNGKVVFYTYRDVLTVLKIINVFKSRWIKWVGDLLPKEITEKLKKIDHAEVSVGVYEKN